MPNQQILNICTRQQESNDLSGFEPFYCSFSLQLLEAEMQVSIMGAQHMREVQRLKDKQSRDTDKEVSKLKQELLEKDQIVRDMEKTMSMKADQLGQAANRNKDELNQEVKGMRDQKTELEKKYRNTQKLLDEYMRKLKEQVRISLAKQKFWYGQQDWWSYQIVGYISY